jgi:hypothetical protein
VSWVVALGLVLFAGCRWHFGVHDEQVDASGSDVDAIDGPPSCGHTFCDNFDRPGPVEAGWDAVINTGNAVLSLVTTTSVSPPQSYDLHHPGTSLEQGFLAKALPTSTSSVVVKLQLAYETSNVNDAEIDMLRVKWDAPAAGCSDFGYFLVRDGTKQLNLQETYGGVACGANEQNYSPDLPNTGWHAAVMTVTLGAVGTARIKLELDGLTIVDHTTSHAIPASTLHFELGAGSERNIVAPWDFRYDDLTVDVQ